MEILISAKYVKEPMADDEVSLTSHKPRQAAAAKLIDSSPEELFPRFLQLLNLHV
jgi:hypothetical protein